MASVFQGCRSEWSAEETLAWAKPLGFKYLGSRPMVEWVTACVQARAPKGGLMFRWEGVHDGTGVRSPGKAGHGCMGFLHSIIPVGDMDRNQALR